MKLVDLLENEALNKAKKFIDKIYNKGFSNPMGPGIVFSFKDSAGEKALIKVDMRPLSDGTVHIMELIVLENQIKKGFGTHVLKLITTEADKQDIKLELTAKPIPVNGQKSISQSKLISFYKKHGFVRGGGNHMTRQPR